jgi:two-component system chemotaxis response regulator CheB
VGVLLSGANQDGAEGLAAIGRAGGAVFVQQPDSAAADAMPRAGLESCPDALSMTPVDIASSLRRISCGSELC